MLAYVQPACRLRIRRRNMKKVSQKRESKVFTKIAIGFYQGLSNTKLLTSNGG